MTVADTNQHYDLDPEIFGLFLDPLRKYSSALYESEQDTLERAQLRKLDFVAERLGLTGGERVIDIGCGWGALLLFLAERYGCTVVGVTPSPRQRDFILRRAEELAVADRVSIDLGHFERLDPGAPRFDAAAMLGSIVHMPDLAGVFLRCHRLLRRGAALYVSESCFRNAAARAEFDKRAGTQFVRDAIFGWGDMRPLSTLVRAAEEAGFSIAGVDDLTAHYRRTIDDWLANVHANRADLDGITPGLADRLTRYLQVANAGWGYTTKHYALVCRRAR